MRALQQLIGNRYPRNIDEIIRESIKLRDPFQHFSTVIISDRNIIKGISQSKPNNLILDNFGTWLAGLLRSPVDADSDVSLTDTGNNARLMKMYDLQSVSCYVFNAWDAGDPVGSHMQCGSGVTPAARADYKIETALGTPPEDDVFVTGAGSYAAGSIAVAGAIVAGGAGTINETMLAFLWRWGTAGDTMADFAMFHDILVSGEAFVLGNTITVAYTINL